MSSFLSSGWRALRMRSLERARANFPRGRTDLDCDLSFTEAARRFAARDDLFAYMHRYFDRLPDSLRAHRAFFATQQRGFGEQAFHSMWYLLLREFRPVTLLEIGVFRGQVISLWSLIGKLQGSQPRIRCISPFTRSGDGVSAYPELDYLQDMHANFRHFHLPEPDYMKALSTDPAALRYLKAEPCDCIYIDGSHDYEIVLSDYQNSVAALRTGGLLVMD